MGALNLLGNGTPTVKNYLAGQVSDVQAFNYALTAPQITALYDQIQ